MRQGDRNAATNAGAVRDRAPILEGICTAQFFVERLREGGEEGRWAVRFWTQKLVHGTADREGRPFSVRELCDAARMELFGVGSHPRGNIKASGLDARGTLFRAFVWPRSNDGFEIFPFCRRRASVGDVFPSKANGFRCLLRGMQCDLTTFFLRGEACNFAPDNQ